MRLSILHKFDIYLGSCFLSTIVQFRWWQISGCIFSSRTIELLISVWYQLPYTKKTCDVKCAIFCFCTPPFFLFFLPPFLILFLQLRRQLFYYIIIILILMLLEATATTSSSSLSSVLSYASKCIICCWIDCLALLFISIFSFFFRIIGTHCCFETNKTTTAEKQFDLLIQQPLPWNHHWCLS